MKTLLVALLLMPLNLAQAQGTPSPSGDAKAGQSSYRGYLCYFCHGDAAEGGFGPDLAGGRGLSLEQFKKQMRQPWGVMLAYTEAQMPDSAVANLHAYFKSLPPATGSGTLAACASFCAWLSESNISVSIGPGAIALTRFIRFYSCPGTTFCSRIDACPQNSPAENSRLYACSENFTDYPALPQCGRAESRVSRP